MSLVLTCLTLYGWLFALYFWAVGRSSRLRVKELDQTVADAFKGWREALALVDEVLKWKRSAIR